MSFFVIVGIILCCYYSNKDKSKPAAVRDDKIVVICPHCDKRVSIDYEGEWTCPHCNNDFTYYKENKQSSVNNQSHVNNQPRTDSEYKISVNCPYCNNSILIKSEGDWNCPNCKTDFTYRGGRAYKSGEVCNEWVLSVVAVLAKISKADGVVTESEISKLKQFLFDELSLNGNQMKEAGEVFNREKQNYSNYEIHLKKLYGLFKEDRSILIGILEQMFRVSHEDGGIHPEQERIINRTIEIFGLSRYDYEEIKNKYIEELDKYYKVLNCSKDSTIEDIKSSYRKLMVTYHPDRYASKDLPEEMMRLAKEKTQDIQEAYEKIREARKF